MHDKSLNPVFLDTSKDVNRFMLQFIVVNVGVSGNFNVVSWLLLIAKMMIPMVIIIFGSLDLYKVVISGDAGDVPKAARSLGYRIILGVFIFLILLTIYLVKYLT